MPDGDTDVDMRLIAAGRVGELHGAGGVDLHIVCLVVFDQGVHRFEILHSARKY